MAYALIMKIFPIVAGFAAFAVIGCEDFNRPFSSAGFDPLSAPGGTAGEAPPPMDDGFKPGQFVTAMMPNTAFFLKKPGADAEADRLLSRGASMKVVANSGSFLKVELDSGEVGFVPSIMVEDPNAAPILDADGNPYSVYLLDGDFETLPEAPPGGNPPSGALPTVIDPTAPPVDGGNPGIDTIPNLPSAEESTPDPVEGEPEPAPAEE